MKRVIALVGPSGSGKSTAATFLHQVVGCDTLHARSALLYTISQQEWARRSRYGRLVSGVDPLVFSKIASFNGNTVVLDGYPRNAEQLRLLHIAGQEHGWMIELLYLEMSSLSGTIR